MKIHHIEICVSDENGTLNVLTHQYGFRKTGFREDSSRKQTVIESGKIIFLITSSKSPFDKSRDNRNSTQFCCSRLPKNTTKHIDSVFNVAVEVGELDKFKCKFPKEDILESGSLRDENHGNVTYFSIQSPCGNVIHTIYEKSNYTGWFLPGFTPLGSSEGGEKENFGIQHVDHIALVVERGRSNHVLTWYESQFLMKRFLMNRSDSEENGVEIKGDVGMRLKVMEFWKCSEIGVASDSEDPLRFVIAESISETGNDQIENFLRNHIGAGVQHIGLSSYNINKTIQVMRSRGAQFYLPPPTYYTDVEQEKAILLSGESIEELSENGLLLDLEADIESDCGIKYLLQVFSKPILNADTFFVEIIQRKGASGFGVGNITALARSINEFKRIKETKDIIM